MIFNRLYLIPPILFILLLGSVIITYIISVSLGHVRPLFPYISDTGTTPPESTMFSQVLNIGAVLIYITLYIRCKAVKTMYSDPKLPHYSRVARINRISLWLSLPVALGASMVANFQETNAVIPHFIGAFLCFVVGLVYFWIHTIISYFTCPVMNTLTLARLRLFFVIVGSISCSGAGLFGLLSYLGFKKTIVDIPKWGPDDGGYELHLVSTFSEWITVLFYAFFVLTFINDFKSMALQSPKMEKLNRTNSQVVDCGTNSVNINSLDNMDRKFDEDNNDSFGKTAEIGSGGSKILLV